MLRITGIQLSTDIILIYLLYRASKERDSVVFKCINISDVNIIETEIFEILPIYLIPVYSLYRDRAYKERESVVFKCINK